MDEAGPLMGQIVPFLIMVIINLVFIARRKCTVQRLRQWKNLSGRGVILHRDKYRNRHSPSSCCNFRARFFRALAGQSYLKHGPKCARLTYDKDSGDVSQTSKMKSRGDPRSRVESQNGSRSR
jgi:hypothetical protein